METNGAGNYQAGVCNIGGKEREQRRRFGLGAILFALGTTISLVLLGASPLWQIPVFFPVFAGALGLLQYYFSFCVYHGLTATSSFSGQSAQVTDASSKAKDEQRSWRLALYALLIALVYTVIAFLVA